MAPRAAARRAAAKVVARANTADRDGAASDADGADGDGSAGGGDGGSSGSDPEAAAVGVKRLQRRSHRAAAAAAAGKAPLPAANLGDHKAGRGRERRQAVSKVELYLPGLLRDYQGVATNKGEAAAIKSHLGRIKRLLADGILAADALGGRAAAAASAAAGDDSDDDHDDGINIELERQRADRFRGWASAIDDTHGGE